MSLFSGIEADDDQARGGFLKRFRGVKASFVEGGRTAAEPAREPRFSEPTRAINPTVSFLGRKLSGDDIEDVDDFAESPGAEPEQRSTAAEPASTTRGAATVNREIASPAPSVAPQSGIPAGVQEEGVAASMGKAYAAGQQALRELEALLESRSATTVRQGQESAEKAVAKGSAGPVADRAGQASSETAATGIGASHGPAPVPIVEAVTGGATASLPAAAVSLGHDGVTTPALMRKPAQYVDGSSAIGADDDDDENEPTSASSGRPVLASADALPDFKRIVTGVDADSTLRITAAVRKEFVAVELQPGIALVAATARFSERAQFSTFLKDLAAHDLLVHEEVIASEEVIAAIYDSKRDVVVKGEREASRAIGNFRDIIEAAHAYGASDVHFEPRDFHSDVEVRFRVNGDLYTYRRLPKNIVRRALSAAYSDLVQKNTNSGNSFQPSAPQSAMIPLVLGRDTVNLRWQSAPAVGGYDVGLRLLDGNFKNYSVLMPHQMGLAPSQLALIDTLNHVSGGITVLTGETGSGKTTLLRALSYMLPDRGLKKQFAVSEPSEYPLPWLSEISIIRRPDESDDEANRKYAEVIRTLMRMDPDDVTISEVRDRVVMGLVSELALTGHPVRFSLHAGDIISAVMRMAGGRLQLPIDELAAEGFINAVGNQKLVPTLCPNCKLPANDVMSPTELELLRSKFGLDPANMACRNSIGCSHCRLEGLASRDGKVAGGTKRPTLVAELYRPTPEFRERVAKRDWSGAREVWRRERTTPFDNEDMTGKTLYEHALFKASRGEIDPQFINRSMQSFEHYRLLPGADGKL